MKRLARLAQRIAAGLVLTATLSACTTTEQVVATAYFLNTLPGYIGINSYRLERKGEERSLISIGRMVGRPINSDRLHLVARSEMAPYTSAEMLTSQDFAPTLESLWDAEQASCATLRAQVDRALDIVKEHLAILDARFALDRYPKLQIQIAPPGRGIAFFKISYGTSLAELNMPLAIALPEDILSSNEKERCEWIGLFAADLGNLLAHELLHIHSAEQFGNDHDMLPEEYLAYLVGLSVRASALGRLPDQLVAASGGELSDDIVVAWDQVLDAHYSVRVNASEAGQFLADLIRRDRCGNREIATPEEHAAFRQFVTEAVNRRVDPRNRAAIRELTCPMPSLAAATGAAAAQ